MKLGLSEVMTPYGTKLQKLVNIALRYSKTRIVHLRS